MPHLEQDLREAEAMLNDSPPGSNVDLYPKDVVMQMDCPNCTIVCQELSERMEDALKIDTENLNLDMVKVTNPNGCALWVTVVCYLAVVEHSMLVMGLLVYIFCCRK